MHKIKKRLHNMHKECIVMHKLKGADADAS